MNDSVTQLLMLLVVFLANLKVAVVIKVSFPHVISQICKYVKYSCMFSAATQTPARYSITMFKLDSKQLISAIIYQ